MEERLAAVGRIMRLEDRRARHSVTASGSDAAGQPLGEQAMSGATPACSQAKQRAGAAPAGHHLVGDEQHAVRFADRAHLGEHARRDRSACRRRRGSAARRSARRRRRSRQAVSSASSVACSRPGAGNGRPLDIEQQRLIGRVEDAARADRHGADRVAVIGAFQREDAAARPRRDCSQKPSAIFSATSTEVEPLSEKKTCVERRRRDRDQLPRQLFGRLDA